MKEETKAGLQQKMRINKNQLDFYSRSENRLKRWIDNPEEYHRFLDCIRERIKYLENEIEKFVVKNV
jgi:hypothetical protein